MLFALHQAVKCITCSLENGTSSSNYELILPEEDGCKNRFLQQMWRMLFFKMGSLKNRDPDPMVMVVNSASGFRLKMCVFVSG